MNEEAEKPDKLFNTKLAEVETLDDIDLEDYIEEEILDEEEAETVSGAADREDINQDEVKVEAGLEKASFYVMVPGDEGEVGRGGGSDHFVKIEPLTRHIFRSETVAAEAEAAREARAKVATIPYIWQFFYTGKIFGEENLHRKTPIFRHWQLLLHKITYFIA